MHRYLFLIIVLAVISTGCAIGHRNTSKQLRLFASAGKYDEAIQYLQLSPLARDQKSRLLYLVEMGLLHHYRGDYTSSNLAFDEARGLIEELFTTRLSGKVSSFISNDNSDFFYGEKYEASLTYFYLSLNNYMLSLLEKDQEKKKQYLEKARSEVIAWDSFLSEMKDERMGKALFKEDLLSKIFGALIHEAQDKANDRQIALQLYKDAKTIFFRNYNLYPSYNEVYMEFRNNFSLLPNMNQEEIEGKYVLKTAHSKAIEEFLNYKIQVLSRNTKDSISGNISFMVMDGLIAPKEARKFEIPMAWGAHQSMAFSMGMGAHITYELPMISEIEKLSPSWLEAIGPDGSVLYQAPLNVIAPLSELAEQAINEHAASIAAKTAARVASKHIAAIVSSAVTYETARSRNDGLMMLLASAGHAAAVATINQSERADTRFWSTLPSSIRLGHFSIPKGTYRFRAIFLSEVEGHYRMMELGQHEVSNEIQNLVLNNQATHNTVQEVAIKRPEVNRKISSQKEN